MNKSKSMKRDIEERYSTRDECYAELGNAIVLQAVTDWKDGWKRLQKNPKDIQAEHQVIDSVLFFRSGWYKTLCEYPAEDLLAKLPEMAKTELLESTKRKWINAYKTIQKLKTQKSTKTNLRKIDGAIKRKTEAEDDIRSKWFINLYHITPEEMIEDCEFIAEQEMTEEAKWERMSKEELNKARGQAVLEAKKRKKVRKSA